MARTNLTGPRVTIYPDPTTGAPRVEAAWGWTSTDGDLMSSTKEITDRLTAAQITTAANILAGVTAKIKATENIV